MDRTLKLDKIRITSSLFLTIDGEHKDVEGDIFSFCSESESIIFRECGLICNFNLRGGIVEYELVPSEDETIRIVDPPIFEPKTQDPLRSIREMVGQDLKTIEFK